MESVKVSVRPPSEEPQYMSVPIRRKGHLCSELQYPNFFVSFSPIPGFRRLAEARHKSWV
jgi:hypothetical protein